MEFGVLCEDDISAFEYLFVERAVVVMVLTSPTGLARMYVPSLDMIVKTSVHIKMLEEGNKISKSVLVHHQ